MTKNKLKTNEFKIKLSIVCTLLALVVLSFFFSSKIEKFLNLNETYRVNQVSESVISKADYEVTYLDVGQGNSAFVRLPDNKIILIDGGNTMYGDEICEFLKSKNVKAIDYMIATHADADHIGGLSKVLERFEVKNILRPFQIAGTGDTADEFVASDSEDLAGVYSDYVEAYGNRSKISRVTSDVYIEFIKLIYNETYFENGKKNFSKIVVFYDGLKILGENYEVEFFAPLVRDESVNLSDKTERTEGFATIGYGVSESNGNSAVFMLSVYGETFLFTGDAPFTSGSKNAENFEYEEIDFINSLTKSERESISKVSVLIVGHHGSKYSTSEELLKIANPEFVVISVGKNNEYDHPHSEVLDRVLKCDNLAEDYLLITSKTGNITFASIKSELNYSLENYERDSSLTISWYELGTIIFISLSYIVVLVKPKDKRRI